MVAYVGYGVASAVATAAWMTYPSGLSAGVQLLAFASSNSPSVPSVPAGWTYEGSSALAAGLRGHVISKVSTGAESGNFTWSGFTGGTKGVAWVAAYGGVPGLKVEFGTDTNTTSTTFDPTGPSWTSSAGEWILAMVTAITTTTFAGNLSSYNVSQAGATVATVGRFGGRTGTNTLAYGTYDGSVISGGTGAPKFTGTGSSNAGGVAALIRLGAAAVANTVPAAAAGADQTVDGWQQVTLDGSGTDTDGAIASYAWAQVSGPTVTLSSTTAAAPTFRAPAPTAAAQTVVLGLTVTDNGGATSTQDTVTITVQPAALLVRNESYGWDPAHILTRSGGAWV